MSEGPPQIPADATADAAADGTADGTADATAGTTADIQAAGAVVFRSGKQVLLVHRPRYDDWSFPKGKLDPGEHPTTAAVREVEEETGLRVRLGAPLSGQRYPVLRGTKAVRYWTARAVGDDDVAGYPVNEEIDAVRWVEAGDAPAALTHPHDRSTLAEALGSRRRTETMLVLRHSQARSRKAWRRDDRLRPLLATGRGQAERMAPVLAAYDVRRVVSSSSTRCVETVMPYAEATGLLIEPVDRLSEEDATRKQVARLVHAAVEELESQGATVLCTHRPVLPLVFGALGLDDPVLEPGELQVLHLRRGRIVATERHSV